MLQVLENYISEIILEVSSSNSSVIELVILTLVTCFFCHCLISFFAWNLLLTFVREMLIWIAFSWMNTKWPLTVVEGIPGLIPWKLLEVTGPHQPLSVLGPLMLASTAAVAYLTVLSSIRSSPFHGSGSWTVGRCLQQILLSRCSPSIWSMFCGFTTILVKATSVFSSAFLIPRPGVCSGRQGGHKAFPSGPWEFTRMFFVHSFYCIKWKPYLNHQDEWLVGGTGPLTWWWSQQLVWLKAQPRRLLAGMLVGSGSHFWCSQAQLRCHLLGNRSLSALSAPLALPVG